MSCGIYNGGMPNDSTTPGYLTPQSSPQYVGDALDDFMAGWIRGISGLSHKYVRPMHQKEAPKRPGIDQNWIAFEIKSSQGSSANKSYAESGVTIQSHENKTLAMHFMGPESLELADRFSAGVEIDQNLDDWRAAGLGLTEVGQVVRGPDLIGQRWFDKGILEIKFIQATERLFGVLPVVGADATIRAEIANGLATETIEVDNA